MRHSGNLVITLHSHLPYVINHGDWPHGTDWLCEAIAESYIPLLNVFNKLMDDGIRPGVTINLSPILCEQLAHPDLPDLFERYCSSRIEAAQADFERFDADDAEAHFAPISKYWELWYGQRLRDFRKTYKRNLIAAFRDLQELDAIEIITCGATHAYFPLVAEDASIRLQLKCAKAAHKRHFGVEPRGIWLPECAYRPGYEWRTYLPVAPYDAPRYRPGVEQLLAAEGIEFFFADEHMHQGVSPLGVRRGNGEFAPIWARDFDHVRWPFRRNSLSAFLVASASDPNGPAVGVMARHRDIAMQVWSGEQGYPGDPDYLDFHKKYSRSNLRYWRVTDNKADMQYKQPYNPEWAQGKIDRQSHHFIKAIEGTLAHYHAEFGREANLCITFDTELFGHWWFEGPAFIEAVLRGIHASPYVSTATASQQLKHLKVRERVALPEGSWGDGGHHDVWINDDTSWMWSLMYRSEFAFKEFIQAHPVKQMNPTHKRIARQALRELMLMQASDWEFLVKTGGARDYAERRFTCHNSDMNHLLNIAVEYAREGVLHQDAEEFVKSCEERNSVFADLDLDWWS